MTSNPITPWQIDAETMRKVTDFILGVSKITANGDWSHELKRCLLLGRKVMTNLDSILKSRDIANKGPSSQGYGFSSGYVWMWELDCEESWAPKKIDAFELWCWRRLLNVPWTARRSNQPILKEISPEYSFIGMNDAEAETPIIWFPDSKNWLIWKNPDAGNDWRQGEKGTTGDEMVG